MIGDLSFIKPNSSTFQIAIPTISRTGVFELEKLTQIMCEKEVANPSLTHAPSHPSLGTLACEGTVWGTPVLGRFFCV